MRERVRIGTRSSVLALWQSNFIKNKLQKLFPELSIELIHIKTKGDKILDTTLSKIGDKGLFTKELENALLDNRIDLAVHSLKDVTTILPEGLTLGAIAEREDTRDVFISHPEKKYSSLEDVPRNGLIATGSLRRKCQLLALHPDLQIIDIRGNINTRLEKLDNSNWDGMILAAAGLQRMGWEDKVTEYLAPEKILPAVGQGALAIEVRVNDERVLKFIEPIDDYNTRQATTAERTLLRRLEGGCQVPIGAWGRIENNSLVLDGFIGSLKGERIIRGKKTGNPRNAPTVGLALAEELIANGANEILSEIRNQSILRV